jgi:hypothetical protein
MARMRPFGLIAVTLAGGGRGVSALAAQTAIVMATVTSARITPAKIQSKIAHLKPQFLNLIRKSDLAAVRHGLELPAFFPWFLLVPRDGGSAMIVRIADEGGLLLCCA